MKSRQMLDVFARMLFTYMGLFPVFLTICMLLAPGQVSSLWLLPIFALAFVPLMVRLQGKWRAFAAAAALTCQFLASFLFLPISSSPLLLAVPILSCALFLQFVHPNLSAEPFKLPFLLFCLAFYAIEQFLMVTNFQSPPSWSVMQPSFIISFLLFSLTALLLTNTSLLETEIRFGRSVPRSIRQINRIHILCLMAGSILLSLIPQIRSALLFLWNSFLTFVYWLADFLAKLIPERETSITAGDGGGSFFMEEEIEEAARNPMLEMIINVIVIILCILILAAVLIRLFKFLSAHLRRLMRRLQEYFGSMSLEYTDTYEDIDTEGTASMLTRRHRTFARRAKTPRDRIRMAYQQRMRRHPEWAPGQTAQEHLNRDAAQIYGRARYSEHPVSDSDAAAFINCIDLPKSP